MAYTRKSYTRKPATANVESVSTAFVDASPSAYQSAILNHVADATAGHAVIEAVAGSGKTSTIVAALRRIPTDKRVAFVAMNKRIADTLAASVPAHVTAKTVHSLGLEILRAHGKARVDLNKFRTAYAAHLDTLALSANARADLESRASRIQQLAGLLRAYQVDCRKTVNLDGVDIDASGEDIELARTMVNIVRRTRTLVDFDDMIDFPAHFNLEYRVFDVIFIDEAQDQSVSQIKLLLNCLAPNGRVIAVGDSRQAIYAFRGAASNSMELLRNELNGAAELPLSVCYRCGSEIVKLAATIVPQIECSTSTPAGEVTSTDSDSAVSAIEDGDFYIARTNAQVIDFAFALYRAGKPFRLQGREFADVLIWEIVKAANHGVESNRLPKAAIVKSTDSFLHHKTAENLSTRLAATSEAKSTLRDTIHTALSFLNNATSIADASELIRAFFAGDTGATLSTVHRVKGLEANTVYCAIASLGADAFYGARPRLARTEEGAKGEENIRYVAYTRAKRKLVLVS